MTEWADLYLSVADFLGYSDVTPDNRADFPREDRAITRAIERGYRAFLRARTDHPWNFLRRRGTLTLLPGVADYPLPRGFHAAVGPFRFADGGGVIQHIAWPPPGPAAGGRPTGVAMGDGRNRATFFPTPSRGASVVFDYLLQPEPPSAEHPRPAGMKNHGDAIEAFILAEADSLENDVHNGTKKARALERLAESLAVDDRLAADYFGNLQERDGW